MNDLAREVRRARRQQISGGHASRKGTATKSRPRLGVGAAAATGAVRCPKGQRMVPVFSPAGPGMLLETVGRVTGLGSWEIVRDHLGELSPPRDYVLDRRGRLRLSPRGLEALATRLLGCGGVVAALNLQAAVSRT